MRNRWIGAASSRAAPRRSRRRRAAGTSSSPPQAVSARPIRCCIPGSARPATKACSAGRAILRSRSCATPSAWQPARTSARRSQRTCRPAPWTTSCSFRSASGTHRSPTAPIASTASYPIPAWRCCGGSRRSEFVGVGLAVMTAYIARRVLAVLPVMAVVALFVFFLLRFAPGDPAAIIAGDDATAESIAAVRAKLGLDRPIVEQFGVWLWGLLHGDMGVSIFSNLPVTRLIAQRLEPTVALTLSTLFVAVGLAVPIGVLAAWKARKLVDRLVMGFAVLGFAMPVFVLAYILIYFFAVQWRLLPVQGYQPIGEGFWPFVESLILPSVALGVTYMALIARITRASMLEVLQQDYIRTANAKGLATNRVLLLHALKNASVPIVTVIGIGIALLISGVVITETVFNIPGLGRLTLDAVLKRDYPIVQGLIIVFAGTKVLVNLMVDISYVFLDPRIRY